MSSGAEIQPLASRGRTVPKAALNFLLLPLDHTLRRYPVSEPQNFGNAPRPQVI